MSNQRGIPYATRLCRLLCLGLLVTSSVNHVDSSLFPTLHPMFSAQTSIILCILPPTQPVTRSTDLPASFQNLAQCLVYYRGSMHILCVCCCCCFFNGRRKKFRDSAKPWKRETRRIHTYSFAQGAMPLMSYRDQCKFLIFPQ